MIWRQIKQNQPDATVHYVASQMVLHTEADVCYLSLPNARSKLATYHYLSDCPEKLHKAKKKYQRKIEQSL